MDSVTAASEGHPAQPADAGSQRTAVTGRGGQVEPPAPAAPPVPVPSVPVSDEELSPDAPPPRKLTPRGLLVPSGRALARSSTPLVPTTTSDPEPPARTASLPGKDRPSGPSGGSEWTDGPEGLDGSPDPDGSPDRDGPDPYAMAFPPGVSTKLESYVYLLVDPWTGKPFFVGRARGDRCFRHLRAARTGTDDSASEATTGTRGHRAKYPMLDHIRTIEAEGRPVRVDILRYGMTAGEARLVEAAANDALGLASLTKLGSQRQPASELGVRLAKQAKFKREHRVVLLRVGARGADTGYEAARHGWRVGRRWTDPCSEHSPCWAVIVAGELVVAVYRIDGWEPTPFRSRPGRSPGPGSDPGSRPESGSDSGSSRASGSGRSTYRYSFTGQRDEELERRYVGRSVAAYLGRGPQSRVTFVWCGPEPTDTRPG
jgi:hypothetical protein